MDEAEVEERKTTTETTEETPHHPNTTTTRRDEVYHSSIAPAYRRTEVVSEALVADQVIAVIFYVAAVLITLIALRFILLLLGAHNTGFVAFIYSLTAPLVIPFRGIFGTTRVNGATFEPESLVAIVVVLLIAYVLAGLFRLLGRNPQEV